MGTIAKNSVLIVLADERHMVTNTCAFQTQAIGEQYQCQLTATGNKISADNGFVVNIILSQAEIQDGCLLDRCLASYRPIV